jgi:pilus assembly protein CpaF
VVPTVAGCIDVVVHCELERSGKRRVVEILTPSGRITGSTIEASAIFTLRGDLLEPTGGYPSKMAKFRGAGLDPVTVLSEVRS